MKIDVIILTILSGFSSWALIKFLIPTLKNRFLDIPSDRSSHKEPIPKGGGLAIVLVSTFLSLYFGNITPLICCPLALIGLIDDYINLPSSLRYGCQFATVIYLFESSQAFKIFPIILLPLIIIGSTGIINFTNFMDGLDGLVAGSMLIVFIYASIIIDSSLWIFVGSLLGFIQWNWSPAKIFMGDVGSTYLGAIYASLILNSSTLENAIGLLLVGSPMLCDAFTCVIRRGIAGQPIFKPHKLHLYQRLNQSNWSHSKVSILYLSSSASIGICLVVGDMKSAVVLSILYLLAGIWLDQKVSKPFLMK